MDPTDVLRVLWRQRWYVLPALLLTLAAAAYVYQLAPRTYETTGTYALVNPAVPTEEQLDDDPELAALSSDNPYLRSADPNLIADAVIARLGAEDTVGRLAAAGIGTDYGVGPGATGNGFVVDITGVGPTPAEAIATADAVGTILVQELHDLQKVNDADDRYLFTAIELAAPDAATEQFSSRLRAVIVVLLGGAVLVFGAASLGRYRSRDRADPSASLAGTTPPAPVPVDAPAPPAPAAGRPRAKASGSTRARSTAPRARAARPPVAAAEPAADDPDPEPAPRADEPEQRVPADRRRADLPTAKRRG